MSRLERFNALKAKRIADIYLESEFDSVLELIKTASEEGKKSIVINARMNEDTQIGLIERGFVIIGNHTIDWR